MPILKNYGFAWVTGGVQGNKIAKIVSGRRRSRRAFRRERADRPDVLACVDRRTRGSGNVMVMRRQKKDPEALLRKTQKELALANRLLREKDRAVKKADDKFEKAAAKHSRKTVKTAIEGMEEHRDILKNQVAK
jgi:hypothetical protein